MKFFNNIIIYSKFEKIKKINFEIKYIKSLLNNPVYFCGMTIEEKIVTSTRLIDKINKMRFQIKTLTDLSK